MGWNGCCVCFRQSEMLYQTCWLWSWSLLPATGMWKRGIASTPTFQTDSWRYGWSALWIWWRFHDHADTNDLSDVCVISEIDRFLIQCSVFIFFYFTFSQVTNVPAFTTSFCLSEHQSSTRSASWPCRCYKRQLNRICLILVMAPPHSPRAWP